MTAGSLVSDQGCEKQLLFRCADFLILLAIEQDPMILFKQFMPDEGFLDTVLKLYCDITRLLQFPLLFIDKYILTNLLN